MKDKVVLITTNIAGSENVVNVAADCGVKKVIALSTDKAVSPVAQPRVVASNGMFYWMHTRTFLKEKTFYPERLRPYEIPWIRAVDVNTPGDYDMLLVLAPWILKMAPASGRQP